jgi:hypothetical protein
MAATANKPHRRRRAKRVGAVSAMMAVGFVSSAPALDWRFEPSVGAAATYTDNVNQRPDDKESVLILSVTPGFTLQSEGSRQVEATMSYYLTGVTRFGGGDDNDLYHNLNARGHAELAEDFLFIDAGARVSQELISLLGSPADATTNSSNRATVGSFSFSPYIEKRFGTFADAEARYTLSGDFIGDNAASDLLSNELRASLNSGSRFNDLSWGLDYSYRDVADKDETSTQGTTYLWVCGSSFVQTASPVAPAPGCILVGSQAGLTPGLGGDTSYVYERANLSLGYALTRKFRLIGNVGNEWITYDNAVAAANNRDDSLWSAGFSWSPSRRTNLEATFGERFFGDTYSLSASYRARTSTWNVSYVEDVNDISQATLTEGTTYLWVCDGKFVDTVFPIAPGPDCALAGSQAGLIPSLADGLYVSKAFRAGVNWGIRKVTYSINAFDVTRVYLLQNNAEDHNQGISAAVSYRFDPITSIYGNLQLEWTEDPAILSGLTFGREDELLTFTLGVNHQFGRDLTGALTYRYYQRDSNDPTAEYTENNLTASVNWRF